MIRALLAAVLLALAASHAAAQVDAEIALERDALLLYEPIRLLVQLTNLSPRPLDLAKPTGEKLWLEVYVTRADDSAVPRTAKPWAPPTALLMPGQKRVLETNLLSVFQVREPGDYRIHVRVNYGDRSAASRLLKLAVERGTPLWQQQAVLPPDSSESSGGARTRLYTLLVHRADATRELFARIQDPDQDRVFCTTRLGPWVNSSDLDAKVDRDGVLHVLQRAGARIFRYSRLTAVGKLAPQRLFSNLGSVPRLAVLGNEAVEVVGGEEIVPGDKPQKLEGIIPTAPVGAPRGQERAPVSRRDGF